MTAAEQPHNEPDDADEPYLELTDVYAYSPLLWAHNISIININDPSSLPRFADTMTSMWRCVTDVHQRLPELGLTLPRWVELLQAALEAEYEAAGSRWAGDFCCDEALSSEMRALMVNMVLRGCPRERVAQYIRCSPRCVDHAMETAKLDDDDYAVARGHLARDDLTKIVAVTGVPRTTAGNKIRRRLAEEPRTNNRQETARRKRQVHKLRKEGHTVAKIGKLTGLTKDQVLYDLDMKGKRGPAE